MTYAETAQLYVDAGWPVPFPLPAGRKHPPPDGVTGQHGVDLAPVHPASWHGGNYGLRMPEGVMGLDVDQYGEKRGADVLADLEARLGTLPAGPWSSSRAWPSGIRFFRVPAGVRLAGVAGPGIEVIQRHHRYAVVWPSVVEERSYTWKRAPESGYVFTREVPSVAELPELPQAWLEFLVAGASSATGPAAAPEVVEQTEVALFAREGCCPEVAGLLADADQAMADAAEGGRHDAMTALAYRAAHLTAAGHLSWTVVAAHLSALWEQHVGAEAGRGQEFVRIMRTALAKVELSPGGDPCLIMGAIVPDPGWGSAQVPLALEVEGVRLFDPMHAWTDSAMADAVLRWHAADVRYLSDSGGWIRRGPEVWEHLPGSTADVARTLVAGAAAFMPRGDAGAEAGSDARWRAERYKSLHSSAGLSRTASYLAANAPNVHELGVRMASLDADPEILWAGGLPWDLRSSGEAPVRAGMPEGTPHLRSAACAPVAQPTPLWDAFCAAVWPDPAHRAWALRVLSIGLTGYADRAMPVLWGEPGRGKTQVQSLVSDVLGSYAVAADARLLGTSEPHASVKLALAGARFATIDEKPRGGLGPVEKLKNLTGGGTETGNMMGRNPVTFRYTHTLCLTSNQPPEVTDDGLRARVRSIECTGSADDVRGVRAIIGQLSGPRWTAERPGVLAALMRHAAGWLEDARSADNPADVELALEVHRREQDPVLAWLDERTVASGETPTSTLYEDFRVFCAARGERHTPPLNSWGQSLSRVIGPTRKTTGGLRVRGISLVGPRVGWTQ